MGKLAILEIVLFDELSTSGEQLEELQISLSGEYSQILSLQNNE